MSHGEWCTSKVRALTPFLCSARIRDPSVNSTNVIAPDSACRPRTYLLGPTLRHTHTYTHTKILYERCDKSVRSVAPSLRALEREVWTSSSCYLSGLLLSGLRPTTHTWRSGTAYGKGRSEPCRKRDLGWRRSLPSTTEHWEWLARTGENVRPQSCRRPCTGASH